MRLSLLGIIPLVSAVSPPVKVSLRSSWQAPPFLFELLETISLETPDSFIPLLDLVTNPDVLPRAEEDTAEALHYAVLQLAREHGLLSKQGSLAAVEMNLAIQAAFDYFEHHAARPDSQQEGCEAWVDWYGTTICDIETLVQVAGHKTIEAGEGSTNESASAYVRPNIFTFDHIHPSTERVLERPPRTAILYGPLLSQKFRELHTYLYEAASKEVPYVEYIVRPTPPRHTEDSPRNYLSGYGVSLDLKKTDYLAVDDRNTRQEVLNKNSNAEQQDEPLVDVVLDLLETFPINEEAPDASVPLTPEELKELGMKATQLISSSSDPFRTLKDLAQNFPRYASPLARRVQVNASIADELAVQDKDISPLGFLRLLKKEREAILSIVGPGLLPTPDKAIELLTHPTLAESSGGKGGVLLRPMYPGQFHQVKLNMFNIVLVADLSQMPALNLLGGTISSIIERAYPFRWGLVPSTDNEDGLKMARLITYMKETLGTKETLQFVKQEMFVDWSVARTAYTNLVNNLDEDDRPENVLGFDEILTGEGVTLPIEQMEAYVKRLDATKESSVTGHSFVNGKYYPLDDDFMRNFQIEVGSQLQYLQEKVFRNELTDDDADKMATYFYDLPGTSKRRSEYILPSPSAPLRIANLPDLVEVTGLRTDHAVFLSSSGDTRQQPISLYIIGDFADSKGLQLLRAALTALTAETDAVPFRLSVLQNSANFDSAVERTASLPWYFSHLIHLGQCIKSTLRSSWLLLIYFWRIASHPEAREKLQTMAQGVSLASIDSVVYRKVSSMGRRVSGALNFQPGQLGLLVNGRNDSHVILISSQFIGPVDPQKLLADDLRFLVEFEYQRRTEPIGQLLATASSTIASIQLQDPSEVGLFDAPQRPRGRHYRLLANKYTAFTFGDNTTSLYHVVAMVDPLSVKAQKWMSLIEWLSNVPDIFIEIKLNPRPAQEACSMPLKRFYQFNIAPALTFDTNGNEIPSQAVFEGLPTEPIYTLAMDVPTSWLVRPREALYDLDNIQLEHLSAEDQSVDATFDLDYIVVEGHARETETSAPPRGVQLELLSGDGHFVDDTLVMANLGYLQFKARPGVFKLDIRSGRARDIYSLESAGNEGWDSPTVDAAGQEITVTSFEGVTLYPRLLRKPGMEQADVLDAGEEEEDLTFLEDVTSRMMSFFNKPVDIERDSDQAEINIFTVASGLLYERFASIMILSVLRNTKHTVKFWFIENFLSPSFLEFIPHFAEEYNFKYELVTYKWPTWLRAQTEKQRIIWAYKILFLDVLFPMDLKKVIFVDADQIVRADLKELVDLDLHGAPYGYTPMGDDNYDMEGFRFWKQGYWKDFLHGLPYHISALYVVDLVRFRQDMLRGQYQQLSADPNSLANLDQDLPNNLQRQVPIFSLHEDWLWCETWCSKDRLHRAKTIDLCQNPLTKEPKLARARQIPEWEEYDSEISRFAKKLAEAGLIRSRVAAADTNVLAGIEGRGCRGGESAR
ncbi:UDP-glucose:glycoprotein glucosyltransferase-domain-containing protein [Flagelloscypha sp. PMI_526]|nr:UDP-glucose:glycoprotein glucosyltransferase-domain-containing protein [Flagelloscypha sp. PMI_526]